MLDDIQMSLRDGTLIHARRLRPSDAERLQAGLSQLSEETRIHRFHSGKARLSGSHLRYLTDVDQVHHIAWGAEDRAHPEDPGVAVVRCIQLPDEPDSAEFAVTVTDEYQGRGLGTLLIGLIALDAADHGLKTMVGVVQPTNVPMLSLLRTLGAQTRLSSEGTVEHTLDLTKLVGWPESRAVAQLRLRLPGWPNPKS